MARFYIFVWNGGRFAWHNSPLKCGSIPYLAADWDVRLKGGREGSASQSTFRHEDMFVEMLQVLPFISILGGTSHKYVVVNPTQSRWYTRGRFNSSAGEKLLQEPNELSSLC